jgi:hypothetical protein
VLSGPHAFVNARATSSEEVGVGQAPLVIAVVREWKALPWLYGLRLRCDHELGVLILGSTSAEPNGCDIDDLNRQIAERHHRVVKTAHVPKVPVITRSDLRLRTAVEALLPPGAPLYHGDRPQRGARPRDIQSWDTPLSRDIVMINERDECWRATGTVKEVFDGTAPRTASSECLNALAADWERTLKDWYAFVTEPHERQKPPPDDHGDAVFHHALEQLLEGLKAHAQDGGFVVDFLEHRRVGQREATAIWQGTQRIPHSKLTVVASTACPPEGLDVTYGPVSTDGADSLRVYYEVRQALAFHMQDEPPVDFQQQLSSITRTEDRKRAEGLGRLYAERVFGREGDQLRTYARIPLLVPVLKSDHRADALTVCLGVLRLVSCVSQDRIESFTGVYEKLRSFAEKIRDYAPILFGAVELGYRLRTANTMVEDRATPERELKLVLPLLDDFPKALRKHVAHSLKPRWFSYGWNVRLDLIYQSPWWPVYAGPPGTGKSQLAKALGSTLCGCRPVEATVDALKAHTSLFYELRGDSWLHADVGESERNVREFFAALRAMLDATRDRLLPVVLLIDELDTFLRRRPGSSRGAGNDLGASMIVPIVLRELDALASSFDSSELIIMSTVNNLEGIDRAVLRDGRLDPIIQINPLDPSEAAETLWFYFSGVDAVFRQGISEDFIVDWFLRAASSGRWNKWRLSELINLVTSLKHSIPQAFTTEEMQLTPEFIESRLAAWLAKQRPAVRRSDRRGAVSRPGGNSSA